MRRSDLWRMALRGWKRLFFPGLLFLIAAVCLGGNAVREGWTVFQEQQEPCRMTATSLQPLSDISELADLDGVLACSLIYQLNASASINSRTAEIALTGIDGAMIKGEWAAGGIYPETSAMPYLVVNETALGLFKESSKGKEKTTIASADWVNQNIELDLGIESAVPAKICGVLRDETKQAPPVVYISLSAAKTLLQQAGRAISANTVWLELQNTGMAAGIEAQLSQSGLSAENTNADMEERWTLLETKGHGDALAAGIALAASVALFSAKLRLDYAVHDTEYVHLKAMGLATAYKSMSHIRWAVFLSAGVLAGLCVTLCLPILHEMLQKV